MDVSIIIINYNTMFLTLNLIETIIKNTIGINYEIILVDNDSKENVEVALEQSKYKENIKLIKSDENLGFGRANNLGVKMAKGKYIFLLNSDTLLLDNSIKKMFDFMEKNIEIAVCGGNLYDGNKLPAHSFQRKFLNEIDYYYNYIYQIITGKRRDFNYSKLPFEVAYVTGADMFIKKSVFEEVGGFDPEFFMYFEETELCFRIKKIGKKIFSYPSVEIIHLEGKSFLFSEKRLEMYEKSKYIYYHKIGYSKNKIFFNYIISQIKSIFCINNNNIKKYKIRKEAYSRFKKDNS